MESLSIQNHIRHWLNENHASASQHDVLLKVLAVGKTSHAWVAAIQRYVKEKSMQSPSKGEIKMACRAILKKL
ncbi:MAG: hypothetical protein GY801_27425 [bacterium]|nr:hypothetical protein [bacterium]